MLVQVQLCRLYAAVPQLVEELSAKQLVGDTGLRVRAPPVALHGDVC